MQSDLEWFCAWVAQHCDDEWEHGKAVALQMYDNPGWQLRVDLGNSSMASSGGARRKEGTPEDDRWLDCWIENGVFHGDGDLTQLPRILSVFREWAQL